VVEEDLAAQWQLDRGRRIYDIITLDVLRERDKSIGNLDEMEDKKGAYDEQEDARELLASSTATVLAFWLLAPALAPGESGAAALRSRRCKVFVLARNAIRAILDVESGTG